MDAEALALHAVPDDELVRRLSELVSHSRRVEADLVAHVGEVDARRLFARKAFPSMFAYCTEGLHLSEAEAYRRITVARGARRHPILLAMLRDGRLHLSGIVTLLPVLTVDNRDELLARATHRSKRQVEELVAAVSPRPDVPAGVRRIPERRGKPDRPSLNGERAGSATGRGELVPGRVETVQGGVQLFPDGVEPTNLGGPRSRPQAALIQPTGARTLPGPVHGQRRAPRQAGTAHGLDALRDPRC